MQSSSDNNKKAESEKKTRRSPNPWIKGVTADMLHNSYREDETEDISTHYTENYVYEKLNREYISRLKVNEKEWLDIAKKAWDWHQDSSARQLAEIFKDLLEKFKDNPRVLKIIEDKMKE